MPVEDVKVQLYYGPMDPDGRITSGQSVDMTVGEDLGDGRRKYTGKLETSNSGRHGFAVRIIPGHELMATPFEPGLIVWDRASSPTIRAPQQPATAGAR
jgi:starch phosphorylase